MEQSPPSEAYSSLASQEIPYIVWNPKINYRIHTLPLLIPILNQTNPIHALGQIYFADPL